MAKKQVAIIGGGLLGLTLAYELAKQDYQVTIFEKNSDWGGLASGIKIEDTTIEKYYHHLFKSDEAIQALIKELGLEDKLEFLESSVGVYVNDKMYEFSTSTDLLKFSAVPIWDRIRAGIAAFYLQKTTSYQPLEKISALDWCNKYVGKAFTGVFWEPLLRGKFGKRAELIPMSWLWARLHVRLTSRENPLVKERLGYIHGGFQQIIDALVAKLQSLNVELKSDVTIFAHEYADNSHNLRYKQGDNEQQQQFDLVVSTVPGPIFTKLFEVSDEMKQKIEKIEYIGATCMLLELDKSLIPFYWLNVNDTSFPFMALIEHTNFVNKQSYNGKTFVYIAKYIDPKEELFAKDKDELIDYYLPYLTKLNKDFRKDWIKESWLFKSPFAQHIVTQNYEIPPYETGIPGLYYVNFSQIYPHDRGTNYAIEQAHTLVDLITANE